MSYRSARTPACRVGQGVPLRPLLIAGQGRPFWMPVVNTLVNAWCIFWADSSARVPTLHAESVRHGSA